MRLVAVDDGSATFEAFPWPQFYNPQCGMHGGYCAALIDSAMGVAVQTKLPAGSGYGTIEMKVNYVRKTDCRAWSAEMHRNGHSQPGGPCSLPKPG